MKLAVRMLVFLYVIFLSTPTLVELLADNIDTSTVYSMFEDENCKKVKTEVVALILEIAFLFFIFKKSLINSNYLLIRDIISTDVISPPPDIFCFKDHFFV